MELAEFDLLAELNAVTTTVCMEGCCGEIIRLTCHQLLLALMMMLLVVMMVLSLMVMVMVMVIRGLHL